MAPQRDWAHATSTTVTGVSVQPVMTMEIRDMSQVGLHADWRLYDRHSALGFWQAGDRVTWNGSTYDVVGDPQVWMGAQGGRHHWEVDLREQPPTTMDTTGTAAALHAGIREVVNEQQVWTP